MPSVSNAAELVDFFAYARHGVEVDPGLVDVRFGEFLVARGLLDRHQLLRALQHQDRRPELRIGICAVDLGFLGRGALTRALATWTALAAVDV